jgi:hypothetical protein
MRPVNHALHQAIGGVTYTASQTVLAASRASAHPAEMDGYWVDRALEQTAEMRRVLDALDAELRALTAEPKAEAA